MSSDRKWSRRQKAGVLLIVGMFVVVGVADVLGVMLPLNLLVYVGVLLVGLFLVVWPSKKTA